AIAEWIRGAVEHLTPADEAGVQLLALTLAQLERAGGALANVDVAIERGDDVDAYLGRMESRARLSRDARAWTEAARKLLHELGLTPAGRAELEDRQLTVVHAHEVQVVLAAWNQAAAEFVPHGRRTAFLARLDEALRVAMPDVVLELPAAEE